MYGSEKKNKDNEDSSYGGGFVADPMLNDRCGIELFGGKSMHVFDMCIDEDFGSMYPNIIIGLNIHMSTMVGKLLINKRKEDIYEERNKMLDLLNRIDDDDDTEAMNIDEQLNIYDAGHEFVEAYVCDNIPMMAKEYFNLPDILTIDSDICKEFDIHSNTKRVMNISNKGKYYLEPVIIDIEEV